METIKTTIEGCYIVQPRVFQDHRGKFVKPFHYEDLKKAGIDLEITEEYYSVSRKNVLRGLHFQTPPKSTAKLVTCVKGQIFDAVVDLRKQSNTYGKVFSIELSEENNRLLYIPEGLAHGFCSLDDHSLMLYMCSEMYAPDNDTGIHWKSAGIEWPIKNPVVSDKDEQLVPLKKFTNPF